MPHVALLGDSIFDNASYVEAGSSVADHLRKTLPSEWDVTLLAADGATTTAVFNQYERLPKSATHIVLSASGNDALWMSGNLFPDSTDNVRDSLDKLGKQRRDFRSNYKKLVRTLLASELPLSICTVYDSVPGLELPEIAGLCAFNDVITRIAFENSASLIDLRIICNERHDYSDVSPIEPSSNGGLKIARAISNAVQGRSPLILR